MTQPPSLERAIAASNRNVVRLLEDAECLLESGRFPSAYAMAVLVQEEAAKVYLLDLIRHGDVPWNEGVKKAIRDHTCKQLLAEVLDYMDVELEAIMERLAQRIPDPPDYRELPHRIKSALNIFRHEKVGAFIEGSPPFWVEDPNYDKEMLRIAEGKLDALKQDALYVRLGRNGELATEPQHAITAEMAHSAFEKAKRLRWAVSGIDEGRPGLLNYEEIREVFRFLFSDPEVLRSQGLLSDST
jgi:AbiV family abortive infection protein